MFFASTLFHATLQINSGIRTGHNHKQCLEENGVCNCSGLCLIPQGKAYRSREHENVKMEEMVLCVTE